MSEMEVAFGKLTKLKTDKSYELVAKDLLKDNGFELDTTLHNSSLDQLQYELYNDFFVYDGEIYRMNIEYPDTYGFEIAKKNENDSIDFILHWYNGGAGMEEVLEVALNRMTKKEKDNE